MHAIKRMRSRIIRLHALLIPASGCWWGWCPTICPTGCWGADVEVARWESVDMEGGGAGLPGAMTQLYVPLYGYMMCSLQLYVPSIYSYMCPVRLYVPSIYRYMCPSTVIWCALYSYMCHPSTVIICALYNNMCPPLSAGSLWLPEIL